MRNPLRRKPPEARPLTTLRADSDTAPDQERAAVLRRLEALEERARVATLDVSINVQTGNGGDAG